MPHKDPEARRAYQRAYQARWRKDNRERIREYNARWRAKPESQELLRKRRREYLKAKGGDKERVYQRVVTHVRRALARGDLIRQPCEVCGAESVQAHHDDYTKPLAVRWLCRSHHRLWHVANTPIWPTEADEVRRAQVWEAERRERMRQLGLARRRAA